MRVAVLANLKINAPTWEGMPPDRWDDLDSEKTIKALIAALESAGHSAEFFEAQITPPHNLIERLRVYAPDICFNIAESHFGDGREAQIPAVLEMLRIPYTGSQVMALALALDKPMTKRILNYHGLPTPEFQVFERSDELIDEDLLDESGGLRYPLFVKPSSEGTSMGISPLSIVRTIPELREQVTAQIARYGEAVLVEHYIAGREAMVGMIGNLKATDARKVNERLIQRVLPAELTFLPILELDTQAHAMTEGDIYTNRMKTQMVDEFRYFCPAPMNDELAHELRVLAAATFRVIGCMDVARVDFRLDSLNDDKPYILEINPLPGLSPGFSDLCLQADAAGWPHEQLINAILDQALARYQMA
ncbi:MAG: ATP-grasp domain-containing protein [Anaerolineae bacterium]|nr:ATP-grasp domain-containing protein [Anaerolineae bacterium]